MARHCEAAGINIIIISCTLSDTRLDSCVKNNASIIRHRIADCASASAASMLAVVHAPQLLNTHQKHKLKFAQEPTSLQALRHELGAMLGLHQDAFVLSYWDVDVNDFVALHDLQDFLLSSGEPGQAKRLLLLPPSGVGEEEAAAMIADEDAGDIQLAQAAVTVSSAAQEYSLSRQSTASQQCLDATTTPETLREPEQALVKRSGAQVAAAGPAITTASAAATQGRSSSSSAFQLTTEVPKTSHAPEEMLARARPQSAGATSQRTRSTGASTGPHESQVRPRFGQRDRPATASGDRRQSRPRSRLKQRVRPATASVVRQTPGAAENGMLGSPETPRPRRRQDHYDPFGECRYRNPGYLWTPDLTRNNPALYCGAHELFAAKQRSQKVATADGSIVPPEPGESGMWADKIDEDDPSIEIRFRSSPFHPRRVPDFNDLQSKWDAKLKAASRAAGQACERKKVWQHVVDSNPTLYVPVRQGGLHPAAIKAAEEEEAKDLCFHPKPIPNFAALQKRFEDEQAKIKQKAAAELKRQKARGSAALLRRKD